MRRQYRTGIYGSGLSRPGKRLRRRVAESERGAAASAKTSPAYFLVSISHPDKRNADAVFCDSGRTRNELRFAEHVRFFTRTHGVVRKRPLQAAARISLEHPVAKRILRKALAGKNRTGLWRCLNVSRQGG